MKNNLTVIIPLYCDQYEAREIFYIISKWNIKSYNLIFIDDCYSENLITSDKFNIYRSPENMGKFWSVNFFISEVKTDYFLTIDPDDVIRNNINSKKLFSLGKKISNLRRIFDLGINNYALKDGKAKWKKINSKNLLVYFNPCLIFNKNNVVHSLKINNFIFTGDKLTYFDDLLWSFFSFNSGRKINFKYRFYKYTKNIGITSDRAKVRDEIYQAKKIYDIFIKKNNYILKDRNMKNRHDSINSRFKEARLIND